MSKEAYFSHDSNARNDEKIIALRIKYGMEGYGIYFGIIERLRENADYTSTTDYSIIAFDLHDFFSQKFIGYTSKRLYGEEVLKKSSTRDLTTKEFADYLEKVNAFATVEMGIVLPQPEDIYWSLYEEKNY